MINRDGFIKRTSMFLVVIGLLIFSLCSDDNGGGSSSDYKDVCQKFYDACDGSSVYVITVSEDEFIDLCTDEMESADDDTKTCVNEASACGEYRDCFE